MRFPVSVLLFLFLPIIAQAKAPFFERWVPLETLLNSDEIEASHFGALEARFANSKMDEILFPNSTTIRGPRLTTENHGEMIKAIRQFVAKNSELEDFSTYLFESPGYQPFSVKRKKNLGVQTFRDFSNGTDANFANWIGSQIRARVHIENTGNVIAFNSKSQVSEKLKSENEIREEIAGTVKVGQKSYSEEVSEMLAKLLLQLWMVENHMGLDPVRLEFLTPFESHRLEKAFFSRMQELGKEFSLSSAFMKNFSRFLGFEPRLAQNFLAQSVVVYPMTRWYGLFKGIGPGECIRCSTNRFFDALMPHTLQFGILKDGYEIGYIGIYKVNGKDSNRTYWYVDTVQSPDLATGSGAILTLIFEQIQRMAMAEGAVVAVSPWDHNGTNFKENVTTYSAWDSLDLEIDEVTFNHSPINDAVFEYVSDTEINEPSQVIIIKSGYSESKKMYDTLARNSYRVRSLAPLPGLSREEKEQYLRGAGIEVGDQTGMNELMNEIALHEHWPPGPQARWSLVQELKANSLLVANSERVRDLINATLFKSVAEVKGLPQDRFTYFVNGSSLSRRQTKQMSIPDLEGFIEEMLPFCPSHKECKKLFDQYSKGLRSTQVLVHLLIPRLEELVFKNWISIFETYLVNRETDSEDYLLGEAIAERIVDWKDFESFIKLANGKAKGKGVMGTKEGRQKIFLKYWESKIHPNWNFNSLAHNVEFLLNSVDSATDVVVRKKLLARASELEHISIVMGLSHSPNKEHLPSFHLAIAKTFERLLGENQNLSRETMFLEGEKLLNSIPSYYDVLVRQAMFQKAESMEDIVRIISMSQPPSKEHMEWYGKVILHAIKRLIAEDGHELSDVSKEDLAPIMKLKGSLLTYVFSTEGKELLSVESAQKYFTQLGKKNLNSEELDEIYKMIRLHYEKSFFEYLESTANQVKKQKPFFGFLEKPRALDALTPRERLHLQRAAEYKKYADGKEEFKNILDQILKTFRVSASSSESILEDLKIETATSCEIAIGGLENNGDGANL